MSAQQLVRPDPDPDMAARVGLLLFDDSAEVNAVMADAVALLRAGGIPVAGLLQRFGERLPSGRHSVWLDDVATGEVIRLDQPRGAGARSCTLDPSALAGAACRLREAAASDAAVIFVPRFGSVEAEGGGLRVETAEAVLSGAVIIMALRPALLPDLKRFLGGGATELTLSACAVADWAARAACTRLTDAAD